MALDLKSGRTTYNSAKGIHHRDKVKKRIIVTLSSVLVIGLMVVGGIVGYAWYSGQNASVIADETPLPTPVAPKTTPQKVDDTVKVGISSQSFTDKVALGKNASLIIKTNPLAACSIRVEYDKQASADSGLVPKKADEYGVASWAWTVETSRPVGKWPVTVTCANAKNSAVLAVDLQVVNAE
ncbi:MAG: hypothetical protein ABIQ64_04195 [Candidatus Saccharimonadales bacterium]